MQLVLVHCAPGRDLDRTIAVFHATFPCEHTLEQIKNATHLVKEDIFTPMRHMNAAHDRPRRLSITVLGFDTGLFLRCGRIAKTVQDTH